ncbi:restriction endonuclease-like protein [Bacillus phage DZ1]|uniref:Restriction endonuclease-like protein n=1 Tax=Bacillus phage DZ1 TaxID=3075862 RepID=A0AA96EMX7_9CAUD|nr:restriction endonuclease-like protein [Bacillus phage DZ1]
MLRDIHEGGKPKKKQAKKWTDGRKFKSHKLDMLFRSNWEIELAEHLHSLGIDFVYEPERFYYRAERESYLPDFFLPQWNVFIEVKGYMDKRSLKRVKLFRKYQLNEYGFMLYEKDERELVLSGQICIKTLLEIAREEHERVKAES